MSSGACARRAAATLAAQPVNHQPMALPGKIVRLREQCRHAFQPFIAKLGNPTAYATDQMFVMRHTACRFVPFESFAEITLDHQATPHQHFERPIDRRCTSARAMIGEPLRHVVSRKMALGPQYHVSNREALRRHRKIMIAQKRAE